jgi:hypothetical protein
MEGTVPGNYKIAEVVSGVVKNSKVLDHHLTHSKHQICHLKMYSVAKNL